MGAKTFLRNPRVSAELEIDGLGLYILLNPLTYQLFARALLGFKEMPWVSAWLPQCRALKV